MKFGFRRYFAIWFGVFLLLWSSSVFGQVAGIKVDSIFIPADDTIKVCKGSSIKYSYAYTGATNITWVFGGGSPPGPISSLSDVSVQYNSNGIFQTTQTVTSGNFADSTFLFVEVSDVVPNSSFSASAVNVCGDSIIKFTPSVVSSNYTYLWDFGDGATSTLPSPTHQFLSAIGASGTTQTFTVRLTVKNEYKCQSVTTNPILIKRVPDASIMRIRPLEYDSVFFNGLPTFRKCDTGSIFKFKFWNATTTMSSITRYEIDWGDNLTSTLNSWPYGVPIDHDYIRGAFIITVRAIGDAGCIGIKKYNVFFGLAPGGGITGVEDNEVCVGEYLRFPLFGYGNNAPGTIYLFSVNDGSPPIFFNPIFPPPDTINHLTILSSCGYTSLGNVPNSFEGTMSIYNACSNFPTTTRVGNLLVSGRPRANLRVNPSPVVCLGTPIRLENTSTFGQVVNGQNNSCSVSGKQVWVISPSTFTLAPGSDTGSFNSSPANCAAWRNGTANLNITFNAVGNYTVKLYVCNDRCGIDSTVRTVCVRTAPQASFTMSKDSSCGPSTVNFSNLSPTGSCQGDVYLWSVLYSDPQGCGNNQNPKFTFVNSTPSSYSPTIQFNVPGRYIIELLVSAKNAGLACSTAIMRDTFYVKDKPKISINPIQPVCITSCILPRATVSICYGTGGPVYSWSFSGGNPDTSSMITPGPICYADTGSKLLTLTVSNECGNTTDTETVMVIPKPVADAGDSVSFCSGQCDSIGTRTVAGLRYQWAPSAGLSNAAIARPRICLINPGPNDTTYQYVLKVSTADTTCFSFDTVSVTVKHSPQIRIVPDSAAICLGDSIRLYVTGADTSNLSYTWSPAAGLNTTVGDTVKASPLVTTSYIVQNLLRNGCSTKDTIRVSIKPVTKADFRWTKTVLCIPVNINTIISNTVHPGNSMYLWYANDSLIGSNTTGAVPSYPIITPGVSVTIKLMVTSNGGCKPDSMQQTFITVPDVTPSFTKTTNSGCAPLTVTFTNTSSSLLSSINFFWDFGDGTTSALTQPPAKTYAGSPNFRDTTYYILLRAYNGCDTSYFRDSIKVLAQPKARFGVDTARGCSPFTITITNTSLGNNINYYWDFGDNSTTVTTTLGSLPHTYNVASVTNYTIRLIAENACGRDTHYVNIVVSPNIIQPRLTVSGNQFAGCAPHLATFNNASIGATQLTWDFGDGTTPVVTPNSQTTVSHVYTNAGTYLIRVRLKNDCSDTTAQMSITVYPSPDANFSVAPATICTGQSIGVINTSINANSYQWFWGDTTSSSFFEGRHTYSSAGTFTIRLIASRVDISGFVCYDTLQRTVVVRDKIQARIIAAPGKLCAPYTMQVSADSAANASLVEWFVFDNSSTPVVIHSFGTVAVHQFMTAGVDSVKLIVHTTPGCTDSAMYRFQVNHTPRASFMPLSVSTCNHDTLIRFTAQTAYTGTDVVTLQWLVNNQLSGAGNPFSYRFNVPLNTVNDSVFIIRALPQNAAGCGDTSAAGRITILAVPPTQIQVSPSITQLQPDQTFTFKEITPGTRPKNYLWEMGDRTRQTRTGKEVTYAYADTGTYNVRLLVTDLSSNCYANDSVRVKIIYVPGYFSVANAMCAGCSNTSLRQFLPLGKGLKTYRLRIYSKWGQLVFETTKLNTDGSPMEPWLGNFQTLKSNEWLEQNAFRWEAHGVFVNGTEWKGMLYPGSSQYVKSAYITLVK